MNILVAVALLITANSNAVAEDSVIASAPKFVIRHRQIACAEALRNDRGKCHAQEQARLDWRVREWLFAKAVELNHISLTDDERARIDEQLAVERKDIEKTAAFFRSLNEFILRMRSGEEMASIARDAAKAGISEEQIRLEARLAPTLEAARVLAARDTEKDVTDSRRVLRSHPYLVAHLKRLIEEQARAKSISVQVAERDFWTSVIAASGLRLLNAEYKMPDMKEF